MRYKKQFWLSEEDAEDLKRKAELTGLSEVQVFRFLLRNYEPREKPGMEFYDALRPMWSISENMNRLVARSYKLDFIDVPLLEHELKKLNALELEIERTFLLPERSSFHWKEGEKLKDGKYRSDDTNR